MGVYVACTDCHSTYPATTHAGLVRCTVCSERALPRLPHAGVHTLEVLAEDW